jgi:hypothetical protein
MDLLSNRLDVSRLASFSGGAGEAIKEPRGLFALLALVALVLYGLSVGKTRALVSLLSIYVAYTLAVLFPFFERVQSKMPESAQAGVGAAVFLILYVLTFIALSHATTKGRLTLGEISVAKVAVISVVQLGLLASMTLSLIPAELAQKSFGSLLPYVSGKYALWAWAAVSLVIMPFMKAHPKKD